MIDDENEMIDDEIKRSIKPQEYAKQLRRAMERNNLSEKDLAKRLGKSMAWVQKTLGKWVVGCYRNAYVVRWSIRCDRCNNYKVIAWIGRDFADALEQAKEKAASANAQKLDVSIQVDIRPNGEPRCRCNVK